MSSIKDVLQREMHNLTHSLGDVASMLSLPDSDKQTLFAARAILQGVAGGHQPGVSQRAAYAPAPAPVKPVAGGQDAQAKALMFFAFPNKGKPWEASDVDYLTGLTQSGSLSLYDVVYASRHLGRTPYSIALKLVSLGHESKEWAEAFHDLPTVMQSYRED